MSRLSLLAASAVLALTAATTQAVIVFYPAPVPTPPCSTLAPYYQQQLYALNHPYGGYGSINLSYENPCDRPTVNLNPQPCQPCQPCQNNQPDTGGYYRKSDLMPRPVAPATSSLAPTSKGVIFIIPKNLLNRPLNTLTPHPQPLALRD